MILEYEYILAEKRGKVGLMYVNLCYPLYPAVCSDSIL
jgi:hypothetical protein